MLKNIFRSINTGFTLLAEILVSISFFVLIATVTIQVLGRSGLFDSPSWTEELTRFALLYLAASGVGLSYIRGDLVNVDIICNWLPKPVAWFMNLISTLIVSGFCLILAKPSWLFTSIGAYQTSPTLLWPMHYIHASVIVLLGLLFIFSLLKIGTLLTECRNAPQKEKS